SPVAPTPRHPLSADDSGCFLLPGQALPAIGSTRSLCPCSPAILPGGASSCPRLHQVGAIVSAFPIVLVALATSRLSVRGSSRRRRQERLRDGIVQTQMSHRERSQFALFFCQPPQLPARARHVGCKRPSRPTCSQSGPACVASRLCGRASRPC